MAKANYVQKGEILDFKNTGDEAIGYHDLVVMGGRVGVAQEVIPAGGVGSVSVTGVYEVPADTTAAFVTGETLYWDEENSKVVKTAGAVVAGWSFTDKVTAGAVALVKIG